MNLNDYIEHRNIPANEIHTPFRWEVDNEEERENLAPKEDYKLLLQHDNKTIYVSMDGYFYPIQLPYPPEDGEMYGVINNEWTKVVLPTDDTFFPSETVKRIFPDSGNIVATVTFSANTFELDSMQYYLNTEKAVTVNVDHHPERRVDLSILRSNSDTYSLECSFDMYVLNTSGKRIEFTVLEDSDRRYPVEDDQIIRVKYTFGSNSSIFIEVRNKPEDFEEKEVDDIVE